MKENCEIEVDDEEENKKERMIEIEYKQSLIVSVAVNESGHLTEVNIRKTFQNCTNLVIKNKIK